MGYAHAVFLGEAIFFKVVVSVYTSSFWPRSDCVTLSRFCQYGGYENVFHHFNFLISDELRVFSGLLPSPSFKQCCHLISALRLVLKLGERSTYLNYTPSDIFQVLFLPISQLKPFVISTPGLLFSFLSESSNSLANNRVLAMCVLIKSKMDELGGVGDGNRMPQEGCLKLAGNQLEG